MLRLFLKMEISHEQNQSQQVHDKAKSSENKLPHKIFVRDSPYLNERSREADLVGRIGEEGAEFPRAGVEWAMGGFCGEGATPVLMVRGAIVFTGDDSRDVSERMESLT